jgi:hypothetical protein
MENGTTNGTTNGAAEAEVTPAKRRGGRRKGSKNASTASTGLVIISAKLPAELVRRLDAAAESSFRTRPSQIAYYIAQGMKSEGQGG